MLILTDCVVVCPYKFSSVIIKGVWMKASTLYVTTLYLFFRFSKQNMLMWGIWQGKGKPPFNVYFEPFASEMMQLYEQGIVTNGSKTIDD